MRYLKCQIANYKSFQESEDLRFSSGINVIIGQNNVGKTALLEALSLGFPSAPHKSIETLPSPRSPINPTSLVRFQFQIDAPELQNILRDDIQHFHIATQRAEDARAEAKTITRILNHGISVSATLVLGGGISNAQIDQYSTPPEATSLQFHYELAGRRLILANPGFLGRQGPEGLLPHRLANIFKARVYAFRAERLNIGDYQMGTDQALAPNAANLAQVLHLLGSNPVLFARFVRYVRAVFPQIKEVTVPPVSANQVRILLWTVEPEKMRPDLAMSLAESGTGLSQVLAILYVVITADQPKVIIIDEPHSFLHPSAVRKLLEILLMHSQHQYIISTHSPTALTSSGIGRLFLLRLDGPRTTVTDIDVHQADALREVLSEVGARLSDVFGADSVLWVEGRTEELCFPLIRDTGRSQGDPISGAIILGVKHTSDFDRRTARAAVEIYRQLTASSALLPPAVGFIFDQEGRSPTQRDDLVRESRGRVKFLRRRMFENYLLAPAAIAAVMNSIEGFRSAPVEARDVEEWIARRRSEPKYLAVHEDASDSENTWIVHVDGARLLADLFKDLSAGRVTYDKVHHGLLLTRWLCENAFGELREIADLIRETLAASV